MTIQKTAIFLFPLIVSYRLIDLSITHIFLANNINLLGDKKLGIVNYIELLLFICLKYKAKKSKTYRKLTMPRLFSFGIFLYNIKRKI